ncbi:MAG: HEPN domain-containing protein [Saprospiraceae bacterium]
MTAKLSLSCFEHANTVNSKIGMIKVSDEMLYLCLDMLSREDYINDWLKTGHESWDAAEFLRLGNKNVEALFFYCLAVEKYLKANWVFDNVVIQAPGIHELQSLLSQTELSLQPALIDFMDTVNRWNLEGRYPDYRFKLHKIATENYMKDQLSKLQELKKCLLERL